MYAQIESPEITKLATMKASGLASQTYMVLALHDWGSGSCYPSVKRIHKLLGGAYHKNSIMRALKWLEDNFFIKRKAKTSKERFTLLLRKVKDKIINTLGSTNQNGYHKTQVKRTKNNIKYYSKRTKINKISKSRKRIQYINEVWGVVTDILDERNNYKWWHNPLNQDVIKSLGLKACNVTLPSTRPAKYSNSDVYEAIQTNIPDEPKEYINKIYQWWLGLQPV